MRIFSVVLLFLLSNTLFAQNTDAPNFVFIFCDDLDVSGLGLYDDTPAVTPHMDALSSEGIAFTNAHANAPICGPSRASVFTGVLPSTSGHFGFSMGQFDWRNNPTLAETTTLFGHFKNNGYSVYAAGKIFHQNRNRIEDFDDLNLDPFQGPHAAENRSHSNLPDVFSQLGISFSPLEDIPSYPAGEGWFAKGQPFFFESNENRDLLGDEISALYLDSILEANSGNAQPLFITLGMYSPHQPFHAPQEYFDLYPLDEIDISEFINSEPDKAVAAFKNRFNADSNTQLDSLISLAPSQDSLIYLKQFIQGYYAGVSFLDDQIGAVMNSLDEHGYADNTYVILSSDHGYHLGSRQLIKKTTLWNESTNVPLVIRGPGITPSVSSQPVSLVDVYPTLLTLAGLPSPVQELDGKRLDVILTNPLYKGTLLSAASIERIDQDSPGTPSHQHHSILVGDYKYILYSSGEDELYNLVQDKNELVDLSDSEQFQKEKAALFNLISSKIDNARIPAGNFQKLYYGDFDQELNGWVPSKQDTRIFVTQGLEQWDSEHVVLNSNTRTLQNFNVKIDDNGEYEFSFVGFTESGTSSIRVSLSEATTNDLILIDEIFEVNSVPTKTDFSFFSESVDSDLLLRIRKLDGEQVHLDEIVIENINERESAIASCSNSEEMNSNLAFSALSTDTLKYIQNQKMLECAPERSLIRQNWFQFEPQMEQGLVVCRTVGPSNPFVEIFESCDSEGFLVCSNERSDQIETLYIDSLVPGNIRHVRIADLNKEFRDFTRVTTLYQDIIQAEVIGNNPFGVTLNDLTYPNFEAENVVFRFTSIDESNPQQTITLPFSPSGFYEVSNFDIPSGSYFVRVAYTIQPLNIQIPFGPARNLALENSFLPQSSEAQIAVYPNPLSTESNTIFLSKEETMLSETGDLFLADITGKVLMQWKDHSLNNSSSLVLPGTLSAGVYFLRINPNGGNSFTIKLIVD